MPKISALPAMTSADGADPAPIVDDSVGSTKKITLTKMKEWLQSLTSWITTAMLADDSVTAAKIDWASTGANGGIWMEELGRTTLSGAADVISVTIPARKYLRVYAYLMATGGNINSRIRFNSDSGNNYADRSSANGGADGTGVSGSGAGVAVTETTSPKFILLDIINIQSEEKLLTGHTIERNTAGAANAPQRAEIADKWANTSAQITTIAIHNLTGSGDYAIGSQLVVLGHD